VLELLVFFFFLINQKYIYKSAKGAQPLVHRGYTKGLGEGGKERKKLRITEHPRGQPARCPREKGKHKKVEEILDRPRGVLKASKVTLTPNTPHNTERDHFVYYIIILSR
jgi:hypothetical protein